MNKLLLAGLLAGSLAGCSTNPNFDPISTQILNPKNGSYIHLLRKDSESHCDSFGCGKNLEFYQFHNGEAQRRADACGWEYGKTSSAHAPGTPEYQKLRAEEEARGQVPGLCQ